MKQEKDPIEKYVSAYEEANDDEECKKKVANRLLKDELIEVAGENGLDVSKNQTKDEIAEKLIKPEVYNQIVSEREISQEVGEKKEGIEGELTPPEPPEVKTEVLEPLSDLISDSTLKGSEKVNELWIDGMKGIEENLEGVTEQNLEYWEELEDEWMEKATEFQEQIDELRERSVLPEDKTKELSVIWRNFFNKMMARVKKANQRTRERHESLTQLVEKHTEKARETFDEESESIDTGKLLGLWSDFSKDLGSELEKTLDNYRRDYEAVEETWKNFADKTEDLIDDLQESQEEQVEELYEMWNSNFEFVQDNVEKGFEDYMDAYEITREEFERHSRKVTESLFELAENVEENYSRLMESYQKTLDEGYSGMFSMANPLVPKKDEKELERLKERVEKLEKKIEED
ncbi:MAG: hypothetical protein ACLFVL_02845 [Candidatus Aenigmatarchaeota archaeon]